MQKNNIIILDTDSLIIVIIFTLTTDIFYLEKHLIL